ncbi:unnamed protein product [Brassica napus]|uniref:(rape) hypothetical protein n=1 Tax=Brassica napus TaxID=3708 RepID=A0A816W9Y2_BRANA|nr:unnamed protein product [Brassica napus]
MCVDIDKSVLDRQSELRTKINREHVDVDGRERRDLHWNSEPAEDLMNQRTQAISDQANHGGGCDGLDGRDDESEASQHLGRRTATTADPELDMC